MIDLRSKISIKWEKGCLQEKDKDLRTGPRLLRKSVEQKNQRKPDCQRVGKEQKVVELSEFLLTGT